MKIKRVFDINVIFAFMTRPDIWATVAEDGQDPMNYMPDPAAVWLGCWSDEGEILALFSVNAVNAVTCEIHAQVLPEHRKVYSRDTGKAALAWIMKNSTSCQKVIAFVPSIYPNVRDYAVSLGFQVEGVNRHSYLKNAEVHDQWMLGVTRSELDGICS